MPVAQAMAVNRSHTMQIPGPRETSPQMLSSEMLSPRVHRRSQGDRRRRRRELRRDHHTVLSSHMFAAHPELMRVFNKANQAIGEQPQTLAASVVAYAVNLIDPDARLRSVMRRIAPSTCRWVSSPYEYPIVGHHLMGHRRRPRRRRHPEIAAAWDEVYWLFGCQLLAEEARLYALGGTDPEQPWRKYRVVERIDESPEIFSLVLAPVEGKTPDHQTGRYVAIAVDLPGGERQPRSTRSPPGRRGLASGDHQARPWRRGATRTARSRTGWATTPNPARYWMSRSRAATWCSTSPTARWCSSRRAWDHPIAASSRTCHVVSPTAKCGSSTPTPHIATMRSTPICVARCSPYGRREARLVQGTPESAPTLHPAAPGAWTYRTFQIPRTRRYSCAVRCRSCRRPERPCSTRASPPSVSTTKSSAPTCGPRTPTTWRAPVAEVVSTLVREPTETQMRLAYTGRVTRYLGQNAGGSSAGPGSGISEWGPDGGVPTRLERTLLGWGRVATVLVLVLGAMAWVGWARGIPGVDPRPPAPVPMTPWTALWLAALASAILVHSGPPIACSGVGRAGLGGGSRSPAAAVLTEYLTGRTFGLDQVWFGDAVRTMQATLLVAPAHPRRPRCSCCRSRWRSHGRVDGVSRRLGGFGRSGLPFVTIVAYLFGAVARLEFAPSTGMAMTTAFGLLLLGGLPAGATRVAARPIRLAVIDPAGHDPGRISVARRAVAARLPCRRPER